MHFLVAESEPMPARQKRRASVGRSSGETYADVLRALVPGAICDIVRPADAQPDGAVMNDLAGYDAVVLTGSPLHLYCETPQTRRVVDFMRAVFASGTPAFGSCAGLQIATVAAGGTVRPMRERREAGFARRIFPTDAGRGHRLLDRRAPAFDAPAIHTDEVETLPDGAILLASNAVCHVQAAEIRSGPGMFWGVQYHPELSLGEVAAALRRQADDLIDHDLARDESEIEAVAGQIDALEREPARRDLLWRLGLDAGIVDDEYRRIEIANFIAHLVAPTRAGRGRG